MSKELYAGRVKVLEYLREYLVGSDLVRTRDIKVGIVGGGRDEPELRILDELKLGYQASVLNIAGDCDYIFDLNSLGNILPEQKFDLILCSQVFEHVWNISNAIENLKKLTTQGGYVFVNVPFSNMVHRDSISDFHTPGYSSNFLAANFEAKGLSTLDSRNFGTRRLYLSIHFLQLWLFGSELRNPFSFGKERSFGFLRRVLNMPMCFLMSSWDNSWEENGQFSSETIIFAKN